MKVTSAQIAKCRLQRILFKDRQVKYPPILCLDPWVQRFIGGSDSFQWAAARCRLLASMIEEHGALTPTFLRSQAELMEKANGSS